MQSIEIIKASDGSGNANVATVQNTRSPGASTIIVDTILGINGAGFAGSMGTPHTFTDPVTGETITIISEATAVDFIGHVDGSNLEIDTIAPGYVDGGSEVGDIVVIRPTTQYGDNIAAVLEVVHEDDGTLKDDVVDTENIVDAAIETALIATNAVTASKLATDAIYLNNAVATGPQGSLSTSEVALTGMSVTFTVPAGGRKVKIEAKGVISNTAAQTSIMRMRKTNIAGSVVDSSSIYTGSATAPEGYLLWAVETLAAGTYTYIVTTQQASGTGTASVGKMLATLI